MATPYTLPFAAGTPTPNPQVPYEGQSPNTAFNWLPEGSQLASDLSLSTTPLVRKDITPVIIEAYRQSFKLMRILFENEVRYKKSFESYTVEEPWNRTPYVTTATANAGATQTITLSSVANIGAQAEIYYPDGINEGFVTAVNTSLNQITVIAGQGKTLPAIAIGDQLTLAAYGKADGANYLTGYGRLGINTRRFLVGRIERSLRYTRQEKQELLNNGTTNYYEKDVANLMKLIKEDAFSKILFGKENVYEFTPSGASNNYKVISPNGILTQLIAGNAPYANTTPSTLVSDFENLLDNTNFQSEGTPKFVVGTERALHMLSSVYKDHVRYEPSSTVSSLDLMEYRVGTQRIVPVPVELMRSSSYMFPAVVNNTIMCLNMEHISPLCVEGFQPFEFHAPTMSLTSGQGLQDYDETTVQANVGAQVDVLASHFYMNVAGL